MEIKKAELHWNGQLKKLFISKIENIMIHHTAHKTWNIYDVHNYHKNSNGWIGIGYNFFVEKDGTIYEARGFNVGAGATNYNYNSLHVCFAGNFEEEEPTKEQIKAGKELVRYLISICPKTVRVIGHKDIGDTLCPGKNFPLEEFKNLREGEPEMRFNKIEEIPEYAKTTIQKLIDRNILKGNENGLDLSEDMIRMFVFNDRAGLYKDL